MKKVAKRVLALLMVMTMFLTAVPANAGKVEVPKKSGHMKRALRDESSDNGPILATINEADKVTVKSSNKKVVTVKTMPAPWLGEKCVLVVVNAKKNGTAIITVKVDKKTYKCKYTVCNYKNPVSSIQVGKYRISGKKFDKTTRNQSLRYSKLAGKNAKVQVKMKRGWKVDRILLSQAGNLKVIKNGESFKVTGGAGARMTIFTYDTKTGIRKSFEVTLR